MIGPISFVVMMKQKFEAKAVPTTKEFRFGPGRIYVISYDVDGTHHITPPYVMRVYFEYRDLDNEDRHGQPKQHVVSSLELSIDSTIQELRTWIVKQVLDFELR